GVRDWSVGGVQTCALPILSAQEVRVLWVSEGPHLVGRYLRFDVGKLLAPGFEPGKDDPVESVPPDEIQGSGAYDAWVRSGSPHRSEERRGGKGGRARCGAG